MSCSLDGAKASSAGQASDSRNVIGRSDGIRAAELRQDVLIGEVEGARVGVAVGDTVTTQSAGASGGSRRVVDDVGLALGTVLRNGGDIAEDIALSENVGAGADLETVAAGLVPLNQTKWSVSMA